MKVGEDKTKETEKLDLLVKSLNDEIQYLKFCLNDRKSALVESLEEIKELKKNIQSFHEQNSAMHEIYKLAKGNNHVL